MRFRFRSAAMALAVVIGGVAPSWGQTDPRIDPKTGQDRGVYPPDVLFEFQHVRLDIEIPDMSRAQFTAKETLTIAPLGWARSALTLDAGPGLTISAVSLNGVPVAFTKGRHTLDIEFGRSLSLGERGTVVIDYTAEKPGGGGAGMTFSPDDMDTPELDPMCHTQGQPESNHLWLPIHDFPNARMTSEIVATVPGGFRAVSNGRLVSIGRHTDGRSTFHWLQDKPHASYLITLIVGKFDVIDVGGQNSARPGLWLPVYGPLGSADILRRNFGNTADMVAYFEKLFDEPYPWDKYANVICRDFSAGAMENTSCTTFAAFGATGPRSMVEGTNAHELVHQWFGDLCGYKSWEHLWLGEGWATFGEALWAEHKRGKIGYQRAIMGDAAQARIASRRGFPSVRGRIVNNVYRDPDSRFDPAVVYAKGGWFLHTLRMDLGDDVFWAGVRRYVHTRRFEQNETDDFRRCMEQESGRSLEKYFQQFAYRPDLPRLQVDLAWDEADSSLKISVEQTQKISEESPAFAFSLPVLIDLGEGRTTTVSVDVSETMTTASFTLAQRPNKVIVDPDLSVMCESKIRTPLAPGISWWIDQVMTGPTLFARVQAAESLREAARMAIQEFASTLEVEPGSLPDALADARQLLVEPASREIP
ncbi:MAG: M1 family metallopeptidase [Phycisphaeraceae bacterium]|nr:M1 family metallopeptidase [Phycisphaeraceae bacterium]